MIWGAMGLYHLGQLGWPVAQIWRDMRSLPANLLRGLSQKEDAQRQASQKHLTHADVILWPVLGLAYLIMSAFVMTPTAVPEPLLLLQQQAQALDGLDIHIDPGLMPLLQHTAFGFIAGIAFLLGTSFSGDIRYLRRTLAVLLPGMVIVGTVIAAQIGGAFPPPIPAEITITGWGPGMAEFLSAFRAPGFEVITPFFTRLYDTGLTGVVLGGLLIILPLIPILRFGLVFRQHILWLWVVVGMGVALGSINFLLAGTWGWESLVILVLPALSVAAGYTRFRLSNPYAP